MRKWTSDEKKDVKSPTISTALDFRPFCITANGLLSSSKLLSSLSGSATAMNVCVCVRASALLNNWKCVIESARERESESNVEGSNVERPQKQNRSRMCGQSGRGCESKKR